MRSSLPALIFLALPFGLVAQVVPADVLNAMRVRLAHSPSATFEATCLAMLVGMPDTLRVDGLVFQRRLETDTVIGGMVRVDLDSTTMTFKPGEIIAYDRSRATGVRDQWPLTVDPTTARLEGLLTLREQLIAKYFAKLIDPKYHLACAEGVFADGQGYWELRVEYPDDKRVTKQTATYTIARADSLPLRVVHQLTAEGEVQHIDLRIRNWNTDPLPESIFSAAAIIPGGRAEDRVEEPDSRPWAVGEHVPLKIAGELYRSDAVLDTLALSSAITVLDFWYMQCGPCRQSIPALDSLYHAFASRGVRFIGANAYDGDPSVRARLETFLATHPIDYPILFISEQALSDFRVSGHPVVYVIDRTGTVRYAASGYFSGLRKAITDELDVVLSEP